MPPPPAKSVPARYFRLCAFYSHISDPHRTITPCCSTVPPYTPFPTQPPDYPKPLHNSTQPPHPQRADIRLLENKSMKREAHDNVGLNSVAQDPQFVGLTKYNVRYLASKRDKGPIIPQDALPTTLPTSPKNTSNGTLEPGEVEAVRKAMDHSTDCGQSHSHHPTTTRAPHYTSRPSRIPHSRQPRMNQPNERCCYRWGHRSCHG